METQYVSKLVEEEEKKKPRIKKNNKNKNEHARKDERRNLKGKKLNK